MRWTAGPTVCAGCDILRTAHWYTACGGVEAGFSDELQHASEVRPQTRSSFGTCNGGSIRGHPRAVGRPDRLPTGYPCREGRIVKGVGSGTDLGCRSGRDENAPRQNRKPSAGLKRRLHQPHIRISGNLRASGQNHRFECRSYLDLRRSKLLRLTLTLTLAPKLSGQRRSPIPSQARSTQLGTFTRHRTEVLPGFSETQIHGC